MKAEVRQKWLKALRSGEYASGPEGYHCVVTKEGAKYGALGVLLEEVYGEGVWEPYEGDWDPYVGSKTPKDGCRRPLLPCGYRSQIMLFRLPVAICKDLGLTKFEMVQVTWTEEFEEGSCRPRIWKEGFEEVADWIEANL